MLKVYDDSESPNEGACSRYMMGLMNRNRQMRGRI